MLGTGVIIWCTEEIGGKLSSPGTDQNATQGIEPATLQTHLATNLRISDILNVVLSQTDDSRLSFHQIASFPINPLSYSRINAP